MENTHEAVIPKEGFQKVQEMTASCRRQKKDGTTQIFAGLIKCADCGWSFAYGMNRQNSKPYGCYHCIDVKQRFCFEGKDDVEIAADEKI